MNPFSPQDANNASPVLQVSGGGKLYGDSWAIRAVDVSLHVGQCLGLAGENGAGKSTLSKAIAGAIRLTEGEITYLGEKQVFKAPIDALRCGIAIVYQETSLVSSMTVAQNVHLGTEKLFHTRRSSTIQAVQLLQSIGFHVDPSALVSTLSAAQKQMVEIARALHWNARVLIFDEPTATLTPEEKQHLFALFGQLKQRGVALVFISHALEELLDQCETISVLRDGELVLCEPATSLTREEIVKHMVGREMSLSGSRTWPSHASAGEKTVSVENIYMGQAVKGMSFSLYAGQVTVMAGLVGAGRTEVAKILSGSFRRRFLHGGRIYLDGKPIRYRTPAQAIRDGIVYVTEDRRANGFFETMSIEENIFIGWEAIQRWTKFFSSKSQSRRIAEHWMANVDIRAAGLSSLVKHLSGGNQQKVVFARAILQKPKVVIFDEPTKGVDVGAAKDIHRVIRELAENGVAVLVISSSLPEVLEVADRILVTRLGRVVEEMDPRDATPERIMFAATY